MKRKKVLEALAKRHKAVVAMASNIPSSEGKVDEDGPAIPRLTAADLESGRSGTSGWRGEEV